VSLRDLEFKTVYYSDSHNLLKEFYVPVLSNAIKYNRIAGYFSSNALAIAAKGIADLVKRGGKIKLIANVVLAQHDQDSIKRAIEEKEQSILHEIVDLEDQLKKDHIRVFGWLIKEGILEIKIAVVTNGIAHQKVGILEDSNGDIISFSGSDNETVKGWLYNDEQFHVFCSWKEGDSDHLKPEINRFETMWNDLGHRVRVYDISQAFKNGLIENAPKNDDEFKVLTDEVTRKLLIKHNEIYSSTQHKDVELWDFQKEAISKWRSNSLCGILSMATGTGKTRTATKGILDIVSRHDTFLCVVCCPQNSILKQWVSEISELDIFDKSIVADSTNQGWRHQLADSILDLRYSKAKIIVYTTYNTFSDKKFIEIVQKYNGLNLLVCDEAHWSGANTFQKGLLESYDYRLGLSATPERYMDDIGSLHIKEYFRGIVYEFSIERALHEINPLTDQTFLCPYIYHPIFVSLNGTELVEYFEVTQKIKRRFAIDSSRNEESDQLQRLLEERQAIITNADSKYTAFEELLASLNDVSFSLTYCSPEQIDKVQEILKNKVITNHRFTGKEKTNVQKKYGGLSQREYILANFERGTYNMLVAMKCLDEGVNITRAEKAILMASSGNPREYIQRRGRLLRRHPEKVIASIYDIIVLPYLESQKALNATNDERKILKKELRRYEHFAESSKYPLEALNKIAEIKKLYGLL
jgi:superfamily II DNA or RNA helicase